MSSHEEISRSQDAKQCHYIEECPTCVIPRTDWTLQGNSISGDRTGFMIPMLNLFLDGGMNSKYSHMRNMLLTHSHIDHSINIPCLAMGNQRYADSHVCNVYDSDNTLKVYCPKEMTDQLRLYCRASRSLNECANLKHDDQIDWVDVTVGDSFELDMHNDKSNMKAYVDVVKCYHTVPSVGFIISVDKKKLKHGFAGRSKKQIEDLENRGINIYSTISEKKLAYLGDTTVKVFDDPSVLSASTIMIECFSIDDVISVEDTEASGHTHWFKLAPIVKRNPKITFILMHFSTKYTEQYIISHLSKDGYPNMILWLPNSVVGLK
jgi:ribonuclease Z